MSPSNLVRFRLGSSAAQAHVPIELELVMSLAQEVQRKCFLIARVEYDKVSLSKTKINIVALSFKFSSDPYNASLVLCSLQNMNSLPSGVTVEAEAFPEDSLARDEAVAIEKAISTAYRFFIWRGYRQNAVGVPRSLEQRGVHVMTHDVSYRKEANEAELRALMRLSPLVSHHPQGIRVRVEDERCTCWLRLDVIKQKKEDPLHDEILHLTPISAPTDDRLTSPSSPSTSAGSSWCDSVVRTFSNISQRTRQIALIV